MLNIVQLADKHVGFRLGAGDLAQLELLREDMGNVSLSEVLRKLVAEEAERRGLGGKVGADFIERLRGKHRSGATLRVVVGAANVEEALIDGHDSDDFEVVLVHDVDGRAQVRLDDPEGTASLLLAEIVRLQPGQELTYSFSLADLTPEMHRAT